MPRLPEELTDRFEVQRALSDSVDGDSTAWLVRTRSAERYVAKVSVRAWHDAGALSALRARAEEQDRVPIVIPTEQLQAGPYIVSITPYVPDGTLAQMLEGMESGPIEPGWIRDVLSQLLDGLEALHTPDPDGVRILHGDLKPSNILVRRTPQGVRYFLSDFELSARLAPDTQQVRSTVSTLSYAAPEVIAGQRGLAADYWALGLMVYEFLTGRRAFDGEPPQAISRLLASTWTPNLRIIEASDWRALIAGLTHRNAEVRWGFRECRRWLAGEPRAIAAGLHLAGEASSSIPFFVGGVPVYGDRGLGRALLRQWDPAVLRSPELATWLEEALGRPDLVALLGQVLAEPQSDEIRLLRFALELAPEAPASWRCRTLSARDLVGEAAAARRGSDVSRDRLTSLLESGCFEIYAARGRTDIGELGEQLQQAVQDYDEAWDEIIARGAPEGARPAADEGTAIAVEATFNDEVVADLRASCERFFDPATLLLRAPWFLTFGTNRTTLSPSRMSILRQLEEASRLEEISVANISQAGDIEIEQLRRGVVVPRTQRRLLSGLVVRESETVHELAPGDRVGPQDLSPVRLAFRAVSRGVRRLVRRLWRRVRNVGEVAPWAGVRLVRLTTDEPVEGVALDDEAYVALLHWRAPESAQSVCIEVRAPDGILKPVRLAARRLPREGQMLLVLAASSRIRFSFKQRRFRPSITAQPIDVRFESSTKLRRPESELIGVEAQPSLHRASAGLHYFEKSVLRKVPATGLKGTSALRLQYTHPRLLRGRLARGSRFRRVPRPQPGQERLWRRIAAALDKENV